MSRLFRDAGGGWVSTARAGEADWLSCRELILLDVVRNELDMSWQRWRGNGVAGLLGMGNEGVRQLGRDGLGIGLPMLRNRSGGYGGSCRGQCVRGPGAS